MAKESAVLMNIKTPRDWNDKDVAQRIKDYERMSNKQDIKTKFVRQGSLIILTAVPYGILHDKVKYENAIKMFMTRMMDVCNIDTERECQLKATLHILEHDEVDIKHSFVLCEDKGTQISIPQADKGFQINSYECDEQMGPEGLERKRIFKFDESIDDDNRFQPHQHSDDETSYLSPSRRSGSNSSLPVDDVLYSNSRPHTSLNDKASALGTRSVTRANSTRSLRSVDSSCGSTASIAASCISLDTFLLLKGSYHGV
ncbi:uncharacterized protein LOC143078630 [Mytilus galloprovincialis]|uniref:uncharacterized protein LOC143078630 n=1 Tax=Mytilus galloprovincialis TaxID=29158 RepID=UPI003F7C1D83